MAESKRTLFFTLDVEPDYGRTSRVSLLNRLPEFVSLMRAEDVPITAFVVGRFFDDQPEVADQLAKSGADVELHGYHHSAADFGSMYTPHTEEIERGHAAYVRRMGHPPLGYRAPSGIIGQEDLLTLRRLGFLYDASIFPVLRQGRYDFRSAPRTPFRWKNTELLEFPCGLLSPRLPAGMTFINWLGPAWSARRLASMCSENAGTCVLDAHLHNFFHAPLACHDLPWGLRLSYQLGRVRGEWRGFLRLLKKLRSENWTFRSLSAEARRVTADALPLPSFAWECLSTRPHRTA